MIYLQSLPRAKRSLARHNDLILQSIISTVQSTDPDPEHAQVHLTKEKHRLRGILPISPTIIRVQSPPIQNYFGYE